jgi:F0F1-type ATP synthase membrane subunit b/b'
MFLSVDGTFWIQLINFGIFFLILNTLFLRPVVKAIQERRAYIDGVAGDYERYRAQIKKLDDEAARVTAEARHEAAEVVARARAAATSEAETIRGDYAARAAEIVDQARLKLRDENAQADAKRPALAASLADQLLQRALNDPGAAA